MFQSLTRAIQLLKVRGNRPDASGHARADRRIQCGRENASAIQAKTGYGTVKPKRLIGDGPARSESSEIRMRLTAD